VLNVLLIEDEALFAKSVKRRLERESYRCTIASTIAEGKAYLLQQLPDIVLLDVRLPDGSGLDLLTLIRNQDEPSKQLPIIVMTAYGELDDAVLAMKLGASDYLKKPVDLDELILILSKVLESKRLTTQLNFAQQRDKQSARQVEMLGQSNSVKAIRAQIDRIVDLVKQAAESHPIILISGETGTGKDVAARLYHQQSQWSEKPFIHVDCTSLPKDLIEAELFGYEKGAFTNAHQAKPGLIEIAENGTLFLDEIGELPLELQAKLLNVLERRVARRLGSTKEHTVSAHFVAATNRNLSEMVAAGEFRSDLFFRLNILELHLSPLRERAGDIALLADYFVSQVARRYGLEKPLLSDEAIHTLESYQWPGNIRELQHALERATMFCQHGQIKPNDLVIQHEEQPLQTQNDVITSLQGMSIEQVEKMMIKASLERSAGNVSKSARELGLTRMAMRYRMDKYQL